MTEETFFSLPPADEGGNISFVNDASEEIPVAAAGSGARDYFLVCWTVAGQCVCVQDAVIFLFGNIGFRSRPFPLFSREVTGAKSIGLKAS